MAKEKVNAILALVDSAKSDDETRYFMCVGYYDAEKLRYAATDGRRLHFVVFTDTEAAERHGFKETGYYEPFGSVFAPSVKKFLDGAQFPIIDRVIPDISEAGFKRFNLDGKSIDDSEYKHGISGNVENFAMHAPRFLIRTGMPINLDYLEPIYKTFSRHGFNAPVYAYLREIERALTIKTDIVSEDMSFTAVIMPIVEGLITFHHRIID